MPFRDTQIVISRQSVLLVTGVGVGLLTLAYVLGVQVGKQSAALRRPAPRSVEDELKALPEPLLDQLKIFESADSAPLEPRPKVEVSPAQEPSPKVEAPVAAALTETTPPPPPESKPATGTWNIQLVATPDPKEADRIIAKAKAAGYAAVLVKDAKFHKVRLAKPLSRADADVATLKLKEKGLKPFLTKAD